jgi:large subunit ribosomal protein L18
MNAHKKQNATKDRRTRRTRAKVAGSADRPRLAVFRSNRGMYVQLIDDMKGHTLAAASTSELGKEAAGKAKVEQGQLLGALIAKKAKEQKVSRAVFDRRGYRFHGRVKAVAEGAKSGGLAI